MSDNRELPPKSAEQRVSLIEKIVDDNPEVAGLQEFEYFRSDNVAVRDRFIDGATRNPEITYSHLSRKSIEAIAETPNGHSSLCFLVRQMTRR